MSESLFEYISIILIFIGVIALLILKNNNYVDFVSFMPANVEMFCLCLILSFVLVIIKLLIFKGSINLFVKLQNIQDRILVAVLMK